MLYVNGESIAHSCFGEPLDAENTDNLLLGGLTQESATNNPNILIDDIAIWRQALMPVQVKALYEIGNRLSYNASEVDTLFNTPKEDGITKVGGQRWQRTALKDTPHPDQFIIRELADVIEIQFGDVMAIHLTDF